MSRNPKFQIAACASRFYLGSRSVKSPVRCSGMRNKGKTHGCSRSNPQVLTRTITHARAADQLFSKMLARAIPRPTVITANATFATISRSSVTDMPRSQQDCHLDHAG
ncbi:hypothetical protein [Lichenifustis flavocetrariae]|uniref:Uncharacterized protein n=1 Tax=Lichenifustis flavocetrariae TaxID=2949735 RepID=A0AA41Z0C5_9HYPH|nr:hypothetical protein [Lichenifustis flavocetrariae]MCW6510567.1 hypothetical protein [Lichenifustis flavocetrariae]